MFVLLLVFMVIWFVLIVLNTFACVVFCVLVIVINFFVVMLDCWCFVISYLGLFGGLLFADGLVVCLLYLFGLVLGYDDCGCCN